MVQCAHNAYRFDSRLHVYSERYSKRRGGKRAVVAVPHEMIRIVFFMLKRGEAYWGEDRGMTERKLTSLERLARASVLGLQDLGEIHLLERLGELY